MQKKMIKVINYIKKIIFAKKRKKNSCFRYYFR